MEDSEADILLRPIKQPRAGWADAFKKVAESKDDQLLEMPESEWDGEKWEW